MYIPRIYIYIYALARREKAYIFLNFALKARGNATEAFNNPAHLRLPHSSLQPAVLPPSQKVTSRAVVLHQRTRSE